jgi:hypothetical protein
MSIFILIPSAIVLYKLLRFDLNQSQSKLTIFLMAIFPVSFLYLSNYSESLFLFLSVSCFYFARRKQFILASILALLVTMVKLPGILIWPALLLEFYTSNSKDINKTLRHQSFPFMFLPPLGLISYIDSQFRKSGDWLFLLREIPEQIILLHQVFFRYLKMMLFTQQRTDPLYFTVLLELSIGLLFLVLLVQAARTLRPSYFLYSLSVYLITTFTGTFSSLPRFVMVLFPLFVVLSKFLTTHKSIKYLYICSSIVLLCVSFALYIKGYPVS